MSRRVSHDERTAILGASLWASGAMCLGTLLAFTDDMFFGWTGLLAFVASACYIGEAECERALSLSSAETREAYRLLAAEASHPTDGGRP